MIYIKKLGAAYNILLPVKPANTLFPLGKSREQPARTWPARLPSLPATVD
jgi:hypothetical protein